MKQYQFEATHRTRGNVERMRATAKNETIARAHIVNYYGPQFDVCATYSDINPAHHILGEIDCTSPGCEDFARVNRLNEHIEFKI